MPGRDITDMYENTRAAGFGAEVRRRVMIGTYVLSAGYYDAYYLRAQKVRTLIKRDFEDCFATGVDAILTPATPSAAFGIGEKGGADPVEMYLNDVFTVTVNMAGLPGIAVPAGFGREGLPLGLQLIGRPFDEETLFSLGEVIEQAAGRFTPPRRWWRWRLKSTLSNQDRWCSKVARHDGTGGIDPGATGDWEVVIGMEVHAQVTSKSKLFSGASTEFGGEPNSHVSLVDAAMPGMLPVINEQCVRQAVRTGLGLKAQINQRSVFDRKNYFYPDLPQGYQISQYKSPIVGEGEVTVELEGGKHRRSASSGCIWSRMPASRCTTSRRPCRFVDLNRSGVALMEIVSKPDMRSSEQAKAYVSKLRSILRYLGTCDGDMEKGSLRADVNVSVRRPGGAARHPLRDQERQFDRLHRPGDRVRGAPPDRDHRGRRHDRSGNPAVRSRTRARPARCAPRKRRTTIAISRIPTCCRWNSTTPMSPSSRRPAGTAGREEGALHRRLWPVAL